MTRSYLIHLLFRFLPLPVWNMLMRAMGKPEHPPLLTFGSMKTDTNAKLLTDGRFAEICERVQRLDPHVSPDLMRYRIYNTATLARLCLNIPGDVVFLGVSYGIGPRVTFEYAGLEAAGKTLHLVDPLTGAGTVPGYNTDPDYVRRQYPESASVILHQQYIPDALPLPGVDRYCFVAANTGAVDAECRSIPVLFDRLSPGGIMIFDYYAHCADKYDPVFASLGLVPVWMPSGQGFVIKR